MFLSHLHFAGREDTILCKSLNNNIHLIEDARQCMCSVYACVRGGELQFYMQPFNGKIMSMQQLESEIIAGCLHVYMY